MMTYNERDDLHNVINHEESQKSMLTEYFWMNNVDPFAYSFLYREFLEYYRWDRIEKEWLRRKQRTQIDRMLYACPVEGERYYLCVLLNHVRGAVSFDDLKTIGTALNSVHDFFNPVYLHVCGGTSQKLSMLFVWLYLSIYHM
jgi:ATP-dependent DNA helicase PIF1